MQSLLGAQKVTQIVLRLTLGLQVTENVLKTDTPKETNNHPIVLGAECTTIPWKVLGTNGATLLLNNTFCREFVDFWYSL